MTSTTTTAQTIGGTDDDARMLPFFSIRSTVRAAGSEDGIVLLDLESGKYHSLNPVGARVWQGLANGRSRAQILRQLTELFDAPPEQIRADVDGILERFTRLGILVPETERPAARSTVEPAAPSELATTPQQESLQSSPARPRFGVDLVWLVRGLFALVHMDVLARRRGFPGVYQAILRSRPKQPRPASQRLQRILAAVQRAASFYYKRRWCLQRSAAAAYLLRRNGFAAQLVLGAQLMPFAAHAWIELDGQVINDDQEFTSTFAVLDRI